MTKTLAQLQVLCRNLDMNVRTLGRPAKEPYIQALQHYFWNQEHPGRLLPVQIEPMLLSNWNDLQDDEAAAVEADQSGWCVQEKMDGVRVLFHIEEDGVRMTGRNLSDTTFRQSEFQLHVPHLTTGLEALVGTILDGELVCPKAVIKTGRTTSQHPLQAVVALLGTTPGNAIQIQEQEDCRLRFIAFDVLTLQGNGLTDQPLSTRLEELQKVLEVSSNPHIELIETVFNGKAAYHERIIADGKEGTVWKVIDGAYEPGKRVGHWLKRKQAVEVEAIVTNFTLGSIGTGNENLIGAVEFSTAGAEGALTPIAWVSNFSNAGRLELTHNEEGGIKLNPAYFGRKAVIAGQNFAARSGRIRHARIVRWHAA